MVLNEVLKTASARPGRGVWPLSLIVFALASMVVGYESAMHFDGVPLDGPFQLYNGLRRIQAGFRPGVDFQYFHGLGVPYVHYWLYAALGRGFRGAELARELLATTLYPVVFLAVFRAFSRRWTVAFASAAVAMAASYLLHMSAMLFAISGMLSLRSALPTLLPIVLLAPLRRGRRELAVGIGLGLALFLSTEQGLAGLLAFFCISAIDVARRQARVQAAADAAAAIALAIIVLALAVFSVAGPAGTLGALKYNFRLVPMDQYWFFGSPPNLFIPSWGVGVRMLLKAPFVALALLISLAAIGWYSHSLWRASDEMERRRAFALAYLSLYGLVSCASLLGVFTRSYAQPCWRVLLIILLHEGARLTSSLDARRNWRGLWGTPTAFGATALGVCAFTIADIALVPTALTVSLPHIVRAHALEGQRFSVVGVWPATLRDGAAAVEAHRRPDGRPPVLWSTYAGWLEARAGIFHPSFDYIIQALGPANRDAYVKAFRAVRPDLVQTVRPTFTEYEAWLENNDWAFYHELLASYRVYSMTPWSIFWERREQALEPARLIGAIEIPDGVDGVQIPDGIASSGPTLVEVEVEYETDNPLVGVPVIGASPRYLVGIDGAMTRIPVSLDPFVRVSRFPLLVAPGQRPTLHFQAFSLLPGARIRPRHLRLFVPPLDDATAPWLAEVIAAFKKPA